MSVKAVIHIVTPKGDGEISVSPGQSIIIGRKSESHCQVDDEKMSGLHCRLVFERDYLKVYDLKSKNGVFLNGIRIENAEMFVGDEIKLGASTFRLYPSKMEKESVELLTFPGPKKDRIAQDLRADFTGTRTQNQTYQKSSKGLSRTSPTHQKEIALRQKANSPIMLSKEEIKLKYRSLSSMAFFFDALVTIIICAVPMIILDNVASGTTLSLFDLFYLYPQDVKDKREMYMLVTAGTVFISFLTINFRFLKFSIGEKASGIQKVYLDQD